MSAPRARGGLLRFAGGGGFAKLAVGLGLAVALSASLFVGVGGAQDNTEVGIRDGSLRRLIEAELGLSQGDTITRADMARVTSIVDSRWTTQRITSLEGLQYATSLTTLELQGNGHTNSDFDKIKGLTSLTSLNLYKNSFTSIDVSALTNLTELNVGVNDLTSLDVSALTSLTSLNVADNEDMTTINLTTNTSLTSLNVSGNGFAHSNVVGLIGLTSLDELIWYEGAISGSVALTVFPSSVTKLYLGSHSSGFTAISLGGTINLQILDIRNNNIPSTTLFGLADHTGLTSLHVGQNNLSGALNLTALTNLERLDVSSNSLTSLTGLTGLTSLKELSLNYNPFINDLATPFDLRALTSLEILQLRGTNLRSINVTGLANLKRIDIRNTQNFGNSGCSDSARIVGKRSDTRCFGRGGVGGI